MTSRAFGWLLKPCGATAGGRRLWLLGSLLWVMVTAPRVTSRWIGPVFEQSDVEWYVKLAAGQHDVMQPFASRQLAPLLVRFIMSTAHVSLSTAFVALGYVSLFVFAGSVLLLVVRDETPRWVVPLIAGMAFWPFSFYALALPDLLFAALTGVFLVLLERRRDLLAALMLFPLTLCREATVLTLVCLWVAGWRRMRLQMLLLATAAMVLGTAVVKHLAAGALDNAQSMPQALYLLGKVPWNGVRNILGLDPFSNLLPCPANPLWQHAFHLRGIAVVGVCRMDPWSPLMTLRALTACFGVLPVLLLFAWRRRFASATQSSVLLRFCLAYGVVSFVLGPGLGTAVDRLVRYAWPAFLVGFPLLAMAETGRPGGATVNGAARDARVSRGPAPLGLRPGMVAALLVLHLLASWAEMATYTWRTIYVSVPAWIAAALLLWGAGRSEEAPAEVGAQLASAA